MRFKKLLERKKQTNMRTIQRHILEEFKGRKETRIYECEMSEKRATEDSQRKKDE